MIYSKLYLQKKTSRPLIAAGIFMAILSLGMALSMHKPSTVRLLSGDRLTRTELVNVTDNQFAVFWESTRKEIGWIEYGNDKKRIVNRLYDDKDLAGSPRPHTLHLVTLKGLEEDTDFYFRIFTTDGAYQSDKSDTFHIRTPKKTIQATNAKPAYGKILLPNGKPKDNIMVFLRIKGNYPLLTLSKQSGEWLIPLNNLTRISDGARNSDIPQDTYAQIDFYDEGGKYSHIDATVANITPLAQTLLLGRNYSLLAGGTVLSASTEVNSVNRSVFSVVYPRENALIPAGKPLIKGTGVKGADVYVFINSKPQYAYRTTVDAKGEWRVLPTQDILPGSYIAAITSKNETGAKVTVNRNFIIAKSGEQVMGVATGEPTLIPTPTESPAPTGLSPAPSSAPSPTTYIVTPTMQPNPTTTEPPKSGGNFDFMLAVGIAFLVVGGGLMLAF